MFFNINSLPLDVFNQASLISKDLGLPLKASGKRIFAKESASFYIEYLNDKIIINYTRRAEIFRGLGLIKNGRKGGQNCQFDNFGLMLDCSKNGVLKLDTIKKIMRISAVCGYNTLQLYTEDTYEIVGEPYFGYLRGGYKVEELKELVEYGEGLGIELVPCIQTLAHLKNTLRWHPYHNICDYGDILLTEEEDTYKLIEKMFKALRKAYKSDKINIGMDEAQMVGLGKYLEKHGYTDRVDIIVRHLARVDAIAKKYSFKPMMWSDMFYRLINKGNYILNGDLPDAFIESLPSDIDIIYWDYYSTDKAHYDKMVKSHQKLKNNLWFAGGVWKWFGYAPQNSYSIETLKASIDSMQDNNVKNMLLTLWEDDGAECSVFSVLPSIVYAAEYAYGERDLKKIKDAFKAIIGGDFDDFLYLDKLNYDRQITAPDSCNPSKYFLYNDYFCGIFDSNIPKDFDRELYRKYARTLKSLSKKNGYGYIFKTLAKLSQVLYNKADLGIQTRKAYREKNICALKALIKRYKNTKKLLKEFYVLFKKQWDRENRPNGFEVIDIRLGGLIKRTEHCAQRLKDYTKKRCESIPELEVDILDSRGEGLQNRVYMNVWSEIVTANNI